MINNNHITQEQIALPCPLPRQETEHLVWSPVAANGRLLLQAGLNAENAFPWGGTPECVCIVCVNTICQLKYLSTGLFFFLPLLPTTMLDN